MKKRVFILEHYFVRKPSAAVCEVFSNAYPDQKITNKRITHRLVTELRDTGRVCDRKRPPSDGVIR